MSSSTSPNQTFLARLRSVGLQSVEAVRNLDGASESEDIGVLVAISEQFTSDSSLEQAMEQEMVLPAIGTVLEEMQQRLSTAKSQSAESELKHALSRLGMLDSDWMAYVEVCRDGVEDRDELSMMSAVVSMLHGSVGHLPDQEMQRSLKSKMEPLQAAFRPQLSMDGMPDAPAVVTLMIYGRPSMVEIIEDLDRTSGSEPTNGCPLLEWTRLTLAIQALRDFTDRYSGMEDRQDVIFQLTNPLMVVEVVSESLDGSFDWSQEL
jgi:hypothetical protein